ETSSTNSWVTDSAAGMTAVVTGRKTANGVVSEAATPEPGSREGTPFKTILEYAEQHGLSTGVVSNMSMADATPAACYAHMHSRGEFGGIFLQIWRPRFGDGVDVVIGNGRKRIREETQALGADIDKELRASGRSVYDSVDAIPANARRVVALFD